MNYIVRSTAQGAASTGEERSSPGPVIVLERRSCDVAVPSVEVHRQSLPPTIDRIVTPGSKKPEHTDIEVAVKREPITEGDSSTQSPRNIYFFKRMVDGRPHFDALQEIGSGRTQLSDEQANTEYALWETEQGDFIYKQSGTDFRVLKCIGNAEYRGEEGDAQVKHKFATKTLGFIAIRGSDSSLDVLKLAVSGTSFIPLRESKDNFLYHARWHRRVKRMARHLGLNLRTFYDGAGKPMTADNCGNWRAGHIEKKLATFMVYAMVFAHGIKPADSHDISLKDLNRLRQRLRYQGLAPHYEIHISRAPCGTPRRPGQCIPTRPVNKELSALHSQEYLAVSSLSSDYDSEEEDLLVHLAEAEGRKDDIVYDGFEIAEDEPRTYDACAADDDEAETTDSDSSPLPQQHIPPEVATKFGENLRAKFTRKEKHTTESTPETTESTESVEEIERELSYVDLDRPPSQSQYWEAPATASTDVARPVRRGASKADSKMRRSLKVKKRRAKALGKKHSGNTQTQNAVLLGCWLTACWTRGLCFCGSPGGDTRLKSADWLMQLAD
ncbi:hypothetical protein CPAR01_13578 [Colletotrichum paranaense]|uniref:Uncharacterized protein n=1 Tax=Colletotrichum paranaense TaxID=1914294 RepID=A0ABQ9S3S2_9PEZI|nr:uncharacterized protein CPAR01_13578 [Colletotrichum paranaense]KAK1524630.1 hypothetical protein CPAR01_13578 [Colletotrichum paranaense]